MKTIQLLTPMVLLAIGAYGIAFINHFYTEAWWNIPTSVILLLLCISSFIAFIWILAGIE